MPRRAVLPLLLTLLMLVPLVVAQDPPIDPPFPPDRATETATATASETATATITPSASATEPEVTETVAPGETATSTETATLTASSTATASTTATSTAESTDFAEVTETLAFESVLEVGTPTNTRTPTTTGTPLVEWCYEFDFTQGTGGWIIAIPPNRGEYDTLNNTGFIAHENYEITRNNMAIHIKHTFNSITTQLLRLTVTYNFDLVDPDVLNGTESIGVLAVTDVETDPDNVFIRVAGIEGMNSVATWTGVKTVDNLSVQVATDATFPPEVPDGSATIRKIRLEGSNPSPFGASNCSPSGTPTPTRTPTATATPTRTPTRTPNPANCIVISRYISNLTEGGTSIIYNARLKLTPAAGETVVITPYNSRPDQVSLSPLSRQLDNSNWNTGRNFTITAVNDTVPEVDESGTITHNATSNVSGSPLNGIVACATMFVNIYDNDGPTPTYTRTPRRTPTATFTSTFTPTVTPSPTPLMCEIISLPGTTKFYHQPTLYNAAWLFEISGTYPNFTISNIQTSRGYLWQSGTAPSILTMRSGQAIIRIGYVYWISYLYTYWVQAEVVTNEIGTLKGYLPLGSLTQAYNCPGSSLPLPTRDPNLPLVSFPVTPPPSFNVVRENVFDSNQAPAVMGGLRIHTGTGSTPDDGGSTVDIVPRNMELCIDSVPFNDIDLCDTALPVPIYSPVDGCAILANEFATGKYDTLVINIDQLQSDTCGSRATSNREVVLTHVDWISRFGSGNFEVVRRGDYLGTLCLSNTAVGTCNVRVNADTHLAFQLRTVDYSNPPTYNRQRPNDIRPFLAYPFCLYDEWQDNTSSNVPLFTRQIVPVHACL